MSHAIEVSRIRSFFDRVLAWVMPGPELSLQEQVILVRHRDSWLGRRPAELEKHVVHYSY